MTRKIQAVETVAKTRKVRVHEQRTYVDEEPVVEEMELELEPTPADPIADFLQSLDTERQLTLHIFVHPNFSRDGKVGSRAERMFVTSFAFTGDEPETYRQRAQYCYPQGGMFTMELRERGAIVKRWEEQLSPVPGHEPPIKSNGYPFPPPPTVSIRMPETQQPHIEPVNPLQVVRDQFGMMREMVSVMKDLSPAPPVVNVGEQQRLADERPIGDRILEVVTLKALENKDTPIDRILDALGGGKREPSWIESLMPVVVELAKAAGPALSVGIQMWMRNQAMAAQQIIHVGPPAESGTPNGVGTTPAALPPSPPMEPAERAWRITVRRLLEDCFEHVTISAVSPDGMSVIPASTNIVDLLDRFQNNEQLVTMIQLLLNSEPTEVVDLCAMLQTNEGDFNEVTGLKEKPAALAWLKELQEETKKTLSEGNEEGEKDNG